MDSKPAQSSIIYTDSPTPVNNNASDECGLFGNGPFSDVSLSSILGNLICKTFPLSIMDTLRISGIALGVIIMLLYLFPQQIVLVVLLLVLIMIFILGLIVKSISQTSNDISGVNPISSVKLDKLRARLLNKQTT